MHIIQQLKCHPNWANSTGCDGLDEKFSLLCVLRKLLNRRTGQRNHLFKSVTSWLIVSEFCSL